MASGDADHSIVGRGWRRGGACPPGLGRPHRLESALAHAVRQAGAGPAPGLAAQDHRLSCPDGCDGPSRCQLRQAPRPARPERDRRDPASRAPSDQAGNGADPGMGRQARARDGAGTGLRLERSRLRQPLGSRSRHHRHELERAPLLRPPRQEREFVMRREAIPHLRCAIYTRVSTEHGLEQEFNSLDNQREAAEAYVKSQAHEGWRALSARYDDGGFSGGSLDRPALQRLLADIRAGLIDVVVVYKVDRLTRSLSDFAKLVELFDAHGVSFVSVTQAFNTTTSMGRLTLNVLLSFAQFEREVTGERIRDKVAASKRKGMRMGGPVPLGYDVKGKKLVINPEEAEQVRLIFRRYLEVRSLTELLRDLRSRWILTKTAQRADGSVRGG